MTVSRLDVLAVRRYGDVVDLDVDVECTAGTYIRAIARDLGAGLGVGGHLTALRRTAVGGIDIAEASTLDALEQRAPDVVGLPMADAARRFLPARDASADEAKVLSHGGFAGTRRHRRAVRRVRAGRIACSRWSPSATAAPAPRSCSAPADHLGRGREQRAAVVPAGEGGPEDGVHRRGQRVGVGRGPDRRQRDRLDREGAADGRGS